MSEKTVHPAPVAEEISPDVADMMDNLSETPVQPDKPEAGTGETPDGTQPEAGTETKPEGEGEVKPGEEKKPEGTAPENPENLNPDNQEYEVAGKIYKTFNEAVAAVKSIAGDNTRITGDNTRLATEVQELQQQRDEANAKYEEALRVNKEWQEYFKNPEDKVAPPAVKQLVKEALKEEKEVEQNVNLAKTYAAEIEALPQEKDFKEVYPIFKGLAEELGENLKKVSPSKLFKMARGLLADNQSATPPLVKPANPNDKSAEELSKDMEKNIALRKEAGKVAGGGGTKGNVSADDVSPELADYFETH